MSLNPTLIVFVQNREGCSILMSDGRVKSYWDPDGKVWTIGYGTTGVDVTQTTVWTKEQCLDALVTKLSQADDELKALSPNIDWPPGAEDALTDFVYNEGSGNYAGSTIRKDVAAGDWLAVKQQLLRWEFAGGKKLAGLENRREGEAAMIDA